MRITPRTRHRHLSASLHEATFDVDPTAISIWSNVQSCK